MHSAFNLLVFQILCSLRCSMNVLCTLLRNNTKITIIFIIIIEHEIHWIHAHIFYNSAYTIVVLNTSSDLKYEFMSKNSFALKAVKRLFGNGVNNLLSEH